MLKTVLFGFMDAGCISLRKLEDNGKVNIRYQYLMDGERPSYRTFGYLIMTYYTGDFFIGNGFYEYGPLFRIGVNGIDGGFPDFPPQIALQLSRIIQVWIGETHFVQMSLDRFYITDQNIFWLSLPHFRWIMKKADFGPQFFKPAHGLKKILAGRTIPFV